MRRWWASLDKVLALFFVVWLLASLLRLLSDARGSLPEPIPTALGVLAWAVPVLVVIWVIRRRPVAH
jgi:hypothetical protein